MPTFTFLTLPPLVTDNPALATLILVAGGLIFSLLVEWLANTLDAARYGWQQRLRHRLGVAEGKRIPELKWLTLSYQLLLWPFIGFVLLHVWGWHDLGDQFSEALTGGGIKLGKVTLVPAHIIMGILWFVLLLTFSRWLKKKLEQDWLPLTGLEASVRVSIATLFGYITAVIAIMVGLSVVGLDLSKLAIVAGALSVGIGFGLQNITNNFFSGLILLFERPVRMGDYIKIAGAEGFVRRIRIRSTELETWDRSSVIVPNSELLSKSVENLSFHDSIGRLILPVQVTYDSDPAEVKALLLQATEGEKDLIADDEKFGLSGPWVFFQDFEGSVLRFELRGYIRDMHAKSGVASRIRYRIFELFKAAGVKMVSGQQDINIRNWPVEAAEKPAVPQPQSPSV
ncbi:MAG: mechanosensitive ion channel domain-containing protein [Pseudomonadota bacterium]